MGPVSITKDRLSSILRAVLLIAGLSTYFIFPDDVVWHFIKTAPRPRLLEHIFFGIAAALLGIALLLKIAASAGAKKQGSHAAAGVRAAVANLLQAIGIGSLLPLPGFLLLVLGDLCISILLPQRSETSENSEIPPASRHAPGTQQAPRWRDGLIAHLGLFCAFLSMVMFSIVLVDRVADVLFAATAVISIVASSRRVLRAKANRS